MLRVNKPRPYKRIWGRLPDESEMSAVNRTRSTVDSQAVGDGIGGGAKRNWIPAQCDRGRSPESVPVELEVGEGLCAVSSWTRSALGAIFDLFGEFFDLLGFFYEGDGEGGVCVGMVDLVL
jgi:hypothetical protein